MRPELVRASQVMRSDRRWSRWHAPSSPVHQSGKPHRCWATSGTTARLGRWICLGRRRPAIGKPTNIVTAVSTRCARSSRPHLEGDHLGSNPRVQLSLKISALSPHLDPIDPEGSYHSVAARLRPIVDLATQLPVSLIFDMEQAETKDLLIDIFTRLFSEP